MYLLKWVNLKKTKTKMWRRNDNVWGDQNYKNERTKMMETELKQQFTFHLSISK